MKLNKKFNEMINHAFVDFNELAWDSTTQTFHRVGKSIKPSGYFFEENSYLGSPWIQDGIADACFFLGAETYMNAGGYIRGNVLVGRCCSIGRRVSIGAGPHRMESLSTSPKIRGVKALPYTSEQAESVHQSKKGKSFTKIESDVWIGDGAIIMPGVTLSLGSVVGANSVVVRDTKPYEIVGGAPAHHLGYRFDATTAQNLVNSEWWEYSKKEINQLPTDNVFQFVDLLASTDLKTYEFQTWRIC